jgi:ribosomal protein S18 acetylase RimI-like enzyme
MQPERSLRPASLSAIPQQMERVFQAVRQAWFGGRARPVPGALLLEEPRGELLMHVRATPDEADQLLQMATARHSFLLRTDWSEPPDLRERLLDHAFHLYHVGETFLYLEGEASRRNLPRRRRPQSNSLAVRIETIPRSRLPVWSEVCRRAFGQRVDASTALAEKEMAWEGMGDRARWYLAWADGIPVATGILLQMEEAAQVLAVGTLPGMRGRGIASSLMRRLIQDWQACGQGFLFLDTEPGGAAARLYQGLGFMPLYRRELWMPRAAVSS